MNKKGILVVLSGFSGAGKGTLVNRLLEKYDNYALSVSATTRAPRAGEREGVSYFYKTKEKFEEMIEQGALLEYACYVDNYYGTPKSYVDEQLMQGKDVILEIEIQGALKVKECRFDTMMLFVIPPDANTLKERLTKRGTETEAVIQSRLKRAAEEAEGITFYDYLIINDDLEACTDQLHNLIQSEHLRIDRNHELMKEIKEEMKSFLEGES